MRELEKMQYVCCPQDGTHLFKTCESVAEIVCPTCGNTIVAKVKFGKVTSYVKETPLVYKAANKEKANNK